MKDSDEFVRAFEIWAPVVAARNNTPRAIRRCVIRCATIECEPRQPGGTRQFLTEEELCTAAGTP